MLRLVGSIAETNARSGGALERVLVDLDPEARAGGHVQQRPVERRTRRSAIVLGEQALGREAVGEARLPAPLDGSACAACAAAAIPTGPSSALER